MAHVFYKLSTRKTMRKSKIIIVAIEHGSMRIVFWLINGCKGRRSDYKGEKNMKKIYDKLLIKRGDEQKHPPTYPHGTGPIKPHKNIPKR